MKKLLTITAAFFLVALHSCDFLDVVPEEFTTEEDIWGDIRNAESALARYYNILYGNLPDDMWSTSDECKNHWEKPAVWAYNNGSWGPTNTPTVNSWDGRYRDVRRGGLLIKNLPGVPIPDRKKDYYEKQLPLYIAEARFLRAWIFCDLFYRWGPVPIVDDPPTPEDVDGLLTLNIPRPSVNEFRDFILGELEECERVFREHNIIKYTATDESYGRATLGAVLALRSRFLLYVASPLHNGNTLYSGVKNLDGKQIFPQEYDHTKWEDAMEAARQFMALEGIYKLSVYDPDPTNYIANYAYQFYESNVDETVFCKIGSYGVTVETALLPNGRTSFKGNGKYSVSQEHIDSYEMNNGYPIRAAGSGYDSVGVHTSRQWDGIRWVDIDGVSNMYRNRDPRLYASIFYHNSAWRYTEEKRTTYYAYWGGSTGDTDGWPKSGTNCESGYNIRKWCSPDVDKVNGKGTVRRNYPLFRFAEAYLNFAEARNEFLDNPDQEVFDAINKVRARVGMPELPILPADNTKEGMRERIRNERRVELAFENNHRMYDVRRWMIGELFNQPITGLNAQPSTAELEATGYAATSKEAGMAVFFKRVKLHDRVFEDKHYLWPVPQDELDRAGFIVQNYGWEAVTDYDRDDD